MIQCASVKDTVWTVMRVKYIITSLILGSFLTGDTGNDACVLRGYRFDRLLAYFNHIWPDLIHGKCI